MASEPQSNGSAHLPRSAPVLSKRELVERILARTGVSRAAATPIIEATLAQLGEALSTGQTLAVPPLGRGRISVKRDSRGGDVITLRLRRPRA